MSEWNKGSGKLTSVKGRLDLVESKPGNTGKGYTAITLTDVILKMKGREEVHQERFIINLNEGRMLDEFRDGLANLVDPNMPEGTNVLDAVMGKVFEVAVEYRLVPDKDDKSKAPREFRDFKPVQYVPDEEQPEGYTMEELKALIVGKSPSAVAELRSDPRVPGKYKAVVTVSPKVQKEFGLVVSNGVYATA